MYSLEERTARSTIVDRRELPCKLPELIYSFVEEFLNYYGTGTANATDA